MKDIRNRFEQGISELRRNIFAYLVNYIHGDASDLFVVYIR